MGEIWKDKLKAMDEALRSIEKQFGKGAVMRLGEREAEVVPSISTGCPSLDAALGCGGYPRGRVVEIFGPESSGKTTLTLHAIAECQKAGGVAAFIDAEHALDVQYATALGVDPNQLVISQPDNGEQALEIAETLVRSGAVDLVVIDSVAALVPQAEIEGEMGDSHVGLQARLMSQALRKLTGITHRTGTTIIQLQNPAVAGDGTPISGSVNLIGSKGATIIAATNNRALELINAEYYFENITITGGRATSVNGGAGVYLHGDRNTKATFKNCSFFDNRLIAPTGVFGGGIRIVGANATFISCIFQGNHGRNRGGAIAIAHGAVDAEADYKVTFDGCYIANNISEYLTGNVEGHGGAFFITNNEGGNLDVDIINSTIQANQANSAGGAMFIEGSALSRTKIKVINSAITDNWGLNAGNGHGIRMVGAPPDTPVPFSTPLEEYFLPKTSEIVAAARKLAAY